MSKPIRVLQVIGSLKQGGAENFIMNMYRNIDRNLVQFDFITHEKGFFDAEVEKLGGKIYYLKYVNKIGPFLYRKQLKRFFEQHSEYKVIHSHVNQTSGIILDIAKKCEVPVRIAHSHSTNTLSNILIKQYKKILQKRLNLVANVKLACSDEAGKWLYGNNDYTVIKNAIDTEKFKFNENNRKKIRKKLNIKEDNVVIGHVGRLEKVKNHEFLLDIFHEISRTNSKYILILIGDGSLRKEIETKVKNMNLEEKVLILGNQENINEFYSAMDIFVFPSLYEGIPLTLIEAICNGLPIYCSSNISHEFKEQKNVKYLAIDNKSNWTNEILERDVKIERYKVDADFINNYDIKKEAKKLQNIYLKQEM